MESINKTEVGILKGYTNVGMKKQVYCRTFCLHSFPQLRANFFNRNKKD